MKELLNEEERMRYENTDGTTVHQRSHLWRGKAGCHQTSEQLLPESPRRWVFFSGENII